MTEQTEIKIVGELSRLALAPGDTVVCKYPGRITSLDVTRIHDNLSKILPGHRILVVDSGAELAAIRPTDHEADNSWRLHAAQSLFRAAAEALAAEGLDGTRRARVMNRILYGDPTPVFAAQDMPLADGGSL